MEPSWSKKGYILGEVARFLAMAGGRKDFALALAEQNQPWNTKLLEVFKAASSSDDLRSNYAEISAADSFVDWMRGSSLIDTVPFLSVAMNTPCRVVTLAPLGAQGTQNQPRIVGGMELVGFGMKPQLITALAVFTKEGLDNPKMNSVVANAMRQGLIAGVDAWALEQLIDYAGSSSIPSTGDAAMDIKSALDVVALTGDESLHLVISPTLANTLSTTIALDGVPKYGDISPHGGSLFGIPVFVSGYLADETAILLDAKKIALASEHITVSAAESTSIDFRGSGLTENPEFISMFTTECVAIKANRNMAIQPLSENAVAVLSGVIWNEESSN